ncbi:Trm112 family protein [Myxococcus faecalis]|uniref:Trm112 family protein n=1 Tax=Myxococcus faecalis TaxID=3115646 RepID=UPI003CF50606
MDAPLLAVLGCPRCKGALAVLGTGATERLHCAACHASWPVKDGVPQLLPELMTREDAPRR